MNEEFKTFLNTSFSITEAGLIVRGVTCPYATLDRIRIINDATSFANGVISIDTREGKTITLAYSNKDRERASIAIEYAKQQIELAHRIVKGFKYVMRASTGTKLEVYDDHLILYFMPVGWVARAVMESDTNAKRINFTDLMSIQFMPPVRLFGRIRFIHPGNIGSHDAVVDTSKDENSIPVSKEDLAKAQEIVDFIENRREALKNKGRGAQRSGPAKPPKNMSTPQKITKSRNKAKKDTSGGAQLPEPAEPPKDMSTPQEITKNGDKAIIDTSDVAQLPDPAEPTKGMSTPQEMFDYCIRRDEYLASTSSRNFRHFELLAKQLKSSEGVKFCFLGFEYNSVSDSLSSESVCAVTTSKRLIIAGYRPEGHILAKEWPLNQIVDVLVMNNAEGGKGVIQVSTIEDDFSISCWAPYALSIKSEILQIVKSLNTGKRKGRRNDAVAPPVGQSQAADPLEELKRLKELLDMGVLTQEEFDDKKKYMLSLYKKRQL